MANITRGFTFSSGDLVTAAKLHSLVDSASISGLTQAALASSSNLITSGGTAPGSPAVGQAWWDTSTTEADGNGILKIYDGTRWQSASKNQEQSLTNRSGGSLTHGDVVVLDTSADNSVTTTTTEASTDFLGIAATGTDGASTIGDQSEGRFVQSGLVVVNTTGTVARGDYLGTSGTVKLAKSLGASPAKGAFGRAIKNTATDKWLVLMSGGVSKLGEISEMEVLSTTANTLLGSQGNFTITSQALGFNTEDSTTPAIECSDPSIGSGATEVWLDVLVTPQLATPIYLTIQGDLTVGMWSNSDHVRDIKVQEYSSTALATTESDYRDVSTDVTDTSVAVILRSTRYDSSPDLRNGGTVKVYKTYEIPNSATTTRHFKFTYIGGNGTGSSTEGGTSFRPVSLNGVILFQQWKVV